MENNIDFTTRMPSLTPVETIFIKKYGEVGSLERAKFEEDAKAFRISEIMKEERRIAKLTQEQLAQKTGTHRSLIARLERGKIELSNAMLNILFETGFGKPFEIGF
jgi:ribosome-binding protein aMBF1 (putative translation factor)